MWFLFVLPREGPSPPAQSARPPPPWRDGECDDEPSGPILLRALPSARFRRGEEAGKAREILERYHRSQQSP